MKRYSLFVQIFSGFLLAISIFSIIIFLFFKLGFSSAINRWEEDSLSAIKSIAIDFIKSNGSIDILEIPQDIPIFIYDKKQELLYSNRGSGKRNNNIKDLISLKLEDKIIGYLYTPQVQFLDNFANERFSETINNSIIFALLFSIIFVLVLSLVITRLISLPAKKIVHFLGQLTDESFGEILVVKGAVEINKITDAVNNLSKRLALEGDIRRQWASDIAHDLRTPVSALKAQFEGMSQGVLDINLKRVNQNLNEVLRMELLVEDLSELMRLEEPEVKLLLSEIDSEDFIRQITIRNDKELKERGISLKIESFVHSFIGDEMLLHRAISNIWNNAIRHTYVNGFIRISIKQFQDYIIFSLNNSGDIISSNELPKIFDRLYRGENTRESRGSGLGLTITKKIVELHKGRITLTSNKELGTTCIVKLPLNY